MRDAEWLLTIRELRGVERVHLIGWSLGGPRAGGYAARYPEKVGKLVLFAPVYRASSPAESSGPLPAGVPMHLQTREELMLTRWGSAVACDDQIEEGIVDVGWQTIMGFEPVGSVWGPPEGVMRVRTFRSYGCNRDIAAKITAPTLLMVGEQDGLLPHSEALYPELTGANKVLAKMACSTHFALWEATQYKFLHEASKEWLIPLAKESAAIAILGCGIGCGISNLMHQHATDQLLSGWLWPPLLDLDPRFTDPERRGPRAGELSAVLGSSAK